MTIVLDRVTKSYPAKGGRRYVLDDVSAVLPADRSIGILGLNGVGKSTLLRLIAGSEWPDRGEIRHDLRMSWPLGLSSSFQGSLTGRENLRFVCRIYGVDIGRVVDFVADFAELGSYFDMPVSSYSSGMRARLAFALSLAIDFDCYLIDETIAVGDYRFQEKCRRALGERRARSTVIMVSHSDALIRQFCDVAAVLSEGRLMLFDTVAAATAYYRRDLSLRSPPTPLSRSPRLAS